MTKPLSAAEKKARAEAREAAKKAAAANKAAASSTNPTPPAQPTPVPPPDGQPAGTPPASPTPPVPPVSDPPVTPPPAPPVPPQAEAQAPAPSADAPPPPPVPAAVPQVNIHISGELYGSATGPKGSTLRQLIENSTIRGKTRAESVTFRDARSQVSLERKIDTDLTLTASTRAQAG